jgi:hypothetical protein
MAQYNERIGECKADNLIANLNVKQITQSVTVKSGAGALERGTLLGLDATGKAAKFGTDDALTAFGILCDAVDATKADAVAEVYVAGVFNKNALILEGELEAADVQALRNGGIFLENSVQ